MPSFSPTLETAIQRALTLANDRGHAMATLEHLLLALIDEDDAARVLRACAVDLEALRAEMTTVIDDELASMVQRDADAKGEAQRARGFQRVIQRASIVVQSATRREVLGGDVVVALFSERDSRALDALLRRGMTRYDAVTFISHGVVKKPDGDKPAAERHAPALDARRFSETVDLALHRALTLANERRHEFSTPEHLLLALLDEPDATQLLLACGADLTALRDALVAFVDDELGELASDDPALEAQPTPGCLRIVQRALIWVQANARGPIDGASLIVAILGERESHAAYFLREQGVTRDDAVRFVLHGVIKNPAFAEAAPAPHRAAIKAASATQDAKAAAAGRSRRGGAQAAHAQPFVFLSYAAEDRRWVGGLRAVLQQAGIAVWWDQDIPPGASWRRDIEEKLAAAGAVLTLWSTASVQSAAVCEEASRAQARHGLVHAVVEACAPPFGFSETQHLDLRSWDGSPSHAGLVRLVEALRVKLDPPEPAAMRARVMRSSPVSVVARDGKLTQIDRPEHAPPPKPDAAQLRARLDALRQSATRMQAMLQSREVFQADPGAVFCFGAIIDAAAAAPPTWFALEDSAKLLEACMAHSQAEASWNPTIAAGASQILTRVAEIRPFLQPAKSAAFLAENEPDPPVAAIDAQQERSLLAAADDVETAIEADEAERALAEDLRASLRRATAQVRDAQAVTDEARRKPTLRGALTKLAYLIGGISTAVTGGVVINLLSAPEAATVLAARLQPVLDALLRAFF